MTPAPAAAGARTSAPLADLPDLLRDEPALAQVLGRSSATIAVPEAARAVVRDELLVERGELGAIALLQAGENPLPLILPHDLWGNAIEQAEIIFTLSLGLARLLKRTQGAVFIQYDGRRFRRVSRYPFLQGLKNPQKVFGIIV